MKRRERVTEKNGGERDREREESSTVEGERQNKTELEEWEIEKERERQNNSNCMNGAKNGTVSKGRAKKTRDGARDLSSREERKGHSE